MIRRTAALLLAAALLLPACTGQSSPGSDEPDDAEPGPVTAQAELNYGRAPTDGGGIVYQPDVVLVGGGADMVRSVSGDSMTWTIDADAPHVEDLEPGKVMFLTGRGVGRVLHLEQRDDTVVVTLGPVDLTDVILDGDISVSSPIDVDAMTIQTFPDVAGPADYGTEASSEAVMPALFTGGRGGSVAGHAPDDKPLPPATVAENVKFTVGDKYSGQIAHTKQGDTSETSLKMAYKAGGLTIGFDLGAKFVAPTVTSNLSIAGGKLTKNELRVDGLKEISVGLDSGSEKGLSGNVKARMEVPAELTFPIAAGAPVPLMASIRFKFIFTTGFSARNGTLAAKGRLEVDGPIGFSGGEVLVPQVTPEKRPVDNVTGISVGINSVVLAMQLKVVVGIGIPAAFAGPFAAFTVSYGITNGSAIGIVQCRQTSTDVIIGGGVGYTLNSKAVDFLNDFVKRLKFPVKVDSEIVQVSKSIVHEVDHEPNTSACG